MATKIGGVFIEIGAKLGPLYQSLAKAEKALKKTATSMQNIGTNLSVGVTAPLAIMGSAAFKMASDYEESLNKVRVAFGNSAGAVEAFSKTTLQRIGLASGSALEMASLFGDMATSMGISQKDAAGLSTSLVTLAGDLSSFKNISISEAQTALSGIFTGETESLKRLGVVMLDSTLQAFALTQGITKQYKEFTQAEKVQLRYAYVMNATKNAQGDFANTSGGAANQMRIFQESVKQLGQSFGTVLLPIITPIIKKVNEMLQSFQNLTSGQKNTILAFAGIAAAIGPLFLIGSKVVGLFVTITGALKTLAAASSASGLAMSLSLGPVSIALVAIGAAIAATIYYWDDLKKAFNDLYVSSEAFRNTMGGIKLLFDLLKAPVIAIIDHFKNLFKAVVNIIGVLSGELSIKQAFSNISEDAYNLGRKFGDNIVKGFKDADTSNKLANLSKITGIQAPSGNRSDSYKKLRELAPKSTGVNTSGLNNTLKDIKSTEIKTLDQQISSLKERIKQLSIAYQSNPSNSLLKNINSEISKLKEKEGILAASEAMIQRLSGVPPTFVIKGSLDFPIDDIRTDVQTKLAEIDAFIELGIDTDGVDAKISVLSSAIKTAFAQTGDITHPLIKDFQSKINAIQPPTFKVIKGGLFDFENADIFDDLKKKLATIDLKASVGLDIDVRGEKLGAINSALSQIVEDGNVTADVMSKINAELTKIGANPGIGTMSNSVSGLLKSFEAASSIIGPLDQLFTQFYNNQSAALDEKTNKQIESIELTSALERDTIEKSLLGEDEKSKRLKAIEEDKAKKLKSVEEKAAKERAAIARKTAIQNKILGIFNATVSMFEGVAKALSLGPAGLPLVPIVKALGLANIAAIASAPLPSLAIGTNYVKSDGLAKLHKGESVVPARVTGHYTQGARMPQQNDNSVIIRNGDLKIMTDYSIHLDKRLRGVA